MAVSSLRYIELCGNKQCTGDRDLIVSAGPEEVLCVDCRKTTIPISFKLMRCKSCNHRGMILVEVKETQEAISFQPNRKLVVKRNKYLCENCGKIKQEKKEEVVY